MPTYAYTLYRGTFIQLPRQLNSQQNLELVCNYGALWVSSADGRIKGFDWQVRGEHGFRELMHRMGWVDVDASINGDGGDGSNVKVKVKVVTAREERNEFFFPGFIGIHLIFVVSSAELMMNRYTHPRTSIPEYRTLRLLDTTRLAGNIHIPSRIRLRVRQ